MTKEREDDYATMSYLQLLKCYGDTEEAKQAVKDMIEGQKGIPHPQVAFKLSHDVDTRHSTHVLYSNVHVCTYRYIALTTAILFALLTRYTIKCARCV